MSAGQAANMDRVVRRMAAALRAVLPAAAAVEVFAGERFDAMARVGDRQLLLRWVGALGCVRFVTSWSGRIDLT